MRVETEDNEPAAPDTWWGSPYAGGTPPTPGKDIESLTHTPAHNPELEENFQTGPVKSKVVISHKE